MNVTELAKRWYDLKAEKEQIEDRVKIINAEIEEISKKTLPKIMEDTEQEKITVTGVGTIYLRPELNCYVKKDIEEQFFNWLREHNHGDIIKETVHHGTLKSWAKEQIENGGELPEQLSVHQFMQAVLRRS